MSARVDSGGCGERPKRTLVERVGMRRPVDGRHHADWTFSTRMPLS